MGNISVLFKPVPYDKGTYYHEFLLWTPDNGTPQFLRGGPASRANRGLDSGGGSGIAGINHAGGGVDIPFGSIRALSGPYVYNDSAENNSPDYAASGTYYSQPLISGTDAQLAPYWNKMLAAGDKINSENIGYAFAGPNSNSVATTLLQAAGLPQPTGNGLNGPRPAPGADMSLLDGKYSPDKGYAELAINAAGRRLHHIFADVHGAEHRLANVFEKPRADGAETPAIVLHLRALAAQARADAAKKPVSSLMALHRKIRAAAKSGHSFIAPIPKRRIGGARFQAAVGARASAFSAGRGTKVTIGTDAAGAPQAARPNVQANAPIHKTLSAEAAGRGQWPSIAPIGGATRHVMRGGNRAKRFATEADQRRETTRPTAPDPVLEATRRHIDSFSLSHEQEAEIRRAFNEPMNRQARLPPNGCTGFDPCLSPAWAGAIG